MDLTPQMDRDNYSRMLVSLKVYNQVGGLLKMTAEQLKNIPKEVMIALAPNEIALVWDKLPNHLQNDCEMSKYRFCFEHHDYDGGGVGDSSSDQGDGPIPRKLFCCYCKISDVTISAENRIKTSDGGKRMISLNPLSCCKQTTRQ